MKYEEKVFLEELLELVRVIEDAQYQDIQAKLLKINDKYKVIKDKENIWPILDDMCGDIPQTYMTLLEYLYEAVKEDAILVKQLQVLTDGVQKDLLDMFYVNFYKWQIARRIFTGNLGASYVERSELHRALADKMQEFLNIDLPVIEKGDRNKDRIVVAIAQFLGLKHGPTRNALDYCYTMQKKMNKEVFLFIASELPLTDDAKGYENFGIDYSYFNYIKEYDGFFCFEYRGEKIKGCQCRVSMENRDQLINILRSIYDWKPYLVYNIGSENILIDQCSRFTEEITIPLGNIFPISVSRYLILPRKFEDRDSSTLEYIHRKNQKVIESIFVYKLEEPIHRFKKTEFEIDENAYVIAIVGSRLNLEINETFIPVLQQILAVNTSVNIAFFGEFSDFEVKKEMIGFPERVKYLGLQQDLRGALNIAQLYLNPPRRGGGTSSVEALAEGVPVITLPSCDVAYSCGEDFYCYSTEDMPKLVRRYMEDQDFYMSQKEKAYRQAERVINTEEVLRGILAQIV